jgi:hypothetical protein
MKAQLRIRFNKSNSQYEVYYNITDCMIRITNRFNSKDECYEYISNLTNSI